MYNKWIAQFRTWFRDEEHKHRVERGVTRIELPEGRSGKADGSGGGSGGGTPGDPCRKCQHCGKMRKDHPGSSFEACNKAAAAKKAAEKAAKTAAVDNTEKGGGKGGREQSSPQKGGTNGGASPGRKPFKDLSEEEKQKIAAVQKGRPCPRMSLEGQCKDKGSCRYSHDQALTSKAAKTECTYGQRCVKIGKFLGGDFKGFPCCVYMHNGVPSAKKVSVDAIEVDEFSIDVDRRHVVDDDCDSIA